MPESILATEPQLRLIVFLGVLVAMAVWVPQLSVVPWHEELVQDDQKEGKSRIHLAGLHHGL